MEWQNSVESVLCWSVTVVTVLKLIGTWIGVMKLSACVVASQDNNQRWISLNSGYRSMVDITQWVVDSTCHTVIESFYSMNYNTFDGLLLLHMHGQKWWSIYKQAKYKSKHFKSYDVGLPNSPCFCTLKQYNWCRLLKAYSSKSSRSEWGWSNPTNVSYIKIVELKMHVQCTSNLCICIHAHVHTSSLLCLCKCV